jgi:hypothetical protein
MRKTTVGWSLCVLWKNGETSWVSLADLKESNPLEVAEYAVSHGIDHEPAFSWWVPNILKKRERIISAVNKRYLKRTHKFGIEVPKSVKDAMRLDAENGNTLWMDAGHWKLLLWKYRLSTSMTVKKCQSDTNILIVT